MGRPFIFLIFSPAPCKMKSEKKGGGVMDGKTSDPILARARRYIDALTVDSPVNVPEEVVRDTGRFFTWDNEHRSPVSEPYLFDWSYYTGVVMEGLFDIWEADRAGGARAWDYVCRYLDALLEEGADGCARLSPTRAGYVDSHGADCYKTASLMLRASNGRDKYMDVCRELYRDLTDPEHINSAGHNIPTEYTEPRLGRNYWHTWRNGRPPKYKVWLDGIYMLQPFLARFAALTGDRAQLKLVKERLLWVADVMRAPNGLYYHAANSREDVCAFHWTRSMGWYGMAIADVAEVLPGDLRRALAPAARDFCQGLLRYQKPSGLWTNLTDRPESATNRLESSGSAMIAYTLLKCARLGLTDGSCAGRGAEVFAALTDRKLDEGGLHDIYLKASAKNENNYEDPAYYLTDEGKGVGPYIMGYSELLRR